MDIFLHLQARLRDEAPSLGHPDTEPPLESSRRRRADASLASNGGDGRGLAGRVGLMRVKDRGGLQLDDLSLDQDGDDLARGEAEGAVVQGGQKLGDGARMRRDADPRALVGGEDIVEDRLGTGGKGLGRLAVVDVPELVGLSETGLEFVGGEQLGNVGLRAAVTQRLAGNKNVGELPEELNSPCLTSDCRSAESCLL